MKGAPFDKNLAEVIFTLELEIITGENFKSVEEFSSTIRVALVSNVNHCSFVFVAMNHTFQ